MRKRKTQRPLIVLIVLGLIALAAIGLGATANAAAATGQVILGRDDPYVTVKLAAGKANNLTIVRTGPNTFRLHDNGDWLIGLVPGCTNSADLRTVTCTLPNEQAFRVWAGDGADRVTYDAPGWGIVLGEEGDDVLRYGSQVRAAPFGSYPLLRYLDGGPGNDILQGGLDDDYLRGGHGNDVLNGGEGDDRLEGGTGADTFVGGGGRYDEVSYDDGVHAMRVVADADGLADDGAAGEGDNIAADIRGIEGGPGPDILYGSDLRDVLSGGRGDDVLAGKGGDDVLMGMDGNDSVVGGPGNDRMVTLEDTDGKDLLLGGTGVDVLSYERRDISVTVSLDGKANDGERGELDNVADDIEVVEGGDGSDQLYGNDQNNTLDGGNGDDFIYGQGGHDTLNGSFGKDAVYGEAGNDKVFGGTGPDSLGGGLGNDAIDGGWGNDVLHGDDGNDTLNGGSGIRPGNPSDADTYLGGAGTDAVTYSWHTAGVTADPDEVADDGGAGEGDRIDASVENIYGTPGNDVLTGSSARNGLFGLAGNDILNLVDGIGNDTADAGAGTDTCRTDPADNKVGCER